MNVVAEITRTPMEQAIDRLSKARMTFEQKTSDGTNYLSVSVPCGNETRRLTVLEADLPTFLGRKFEAIGFLQGFDAIWSTDGFIETALQSSSSIPWFALSDRLGIASRDDRLVIRKGTELGTAGPAMSLGPATDDFAVLDGLQHSFGLNSDGLRRRITLRAEGFGSITEKDAQSLIHSVCDSFLFQFEQVAKVTFSVALQRIPRTIRVGGPKIDTSMLRFPTVEYDQDPMSLYWHASVSRGMPLQQFLGYYQVLEFYFPVYSRQHAIKVARRIIMEPRFSVKSDEQVTRLIKVLENTGVKGSVDERSQLRMCISECVSAAEIIEYFDERPEQKDYFQKPKKHNSICIQQVDLSGDEEALFRTVAERVYQIRCRIVHTKTAEPQDDQQPLLPFSVGASQLGQDIGLVRFLAQHALIAAARSTSL